MNNYIILIFYVIPVAFNLIKTIFEINSREDKLSNEEIFAVALMLSFLPVLNILFCFTPLQNVLNKLEK